MPLKAATAGYSGAWQPVVDHQHVGKQRLSRPVAAVLREKLPAVTVNVSVELQAKKTAAEVAGDVVKLLDGKKPTLVVWQTGTVDAMRSVDPDDFRGAVDDGVAALQKPEPTSF